MPFSFLASDNIISIVINPDAMILNWIKPDAYQKKIFKITSKNEKPSSYAVLAHKLLPLKMHHSPLALYNLSVLQQQICAFLDHYKLRNAYCSIALDAPLIQEQICIVSHANPTRKELGLSEKHWFFNDYTYIGTHENGHMFYTCSIHRAYLLQYQLLMRTLPLHLISIRSSLHVRLQLYKYSQGIHYIQSKLTKLLANNALQDFFKDSIFNKVLSCAVNDQRQDESKQSLSTALGLTIGSGLYENVEDNL